MCRLDPFGNAFEAQRFLRDHRNSCRNHCFGHRQRPATGMTTDQTDQTLAFPGIAPVVDRLVTDVELAANRRRMLGGVKPQQPRSTRSRVPPRMVDRQLQQSGHFAFSQHQAQFLVHQSLPVVDLATNPKHVSNQFF